MWKRFAVARIDPITGNIRFSAAEERALTSAKALRAYVATAQPEVAAIVMRTAIERAAKGLTALPAPAADEQGHLRTARGRGSLRAATVQRGPTPLPTLPRPAALTIETVVDLASKDEELAHHLYVQLHTTFVRSRELEVGRRGARAGAGTGAAPRLPVAMGRRLLRTTVEEAMRAGSNYRALRYLFQASLSAVPAQAVAAELGAIGSEVDAASERGRRTLLTMDPLAAVPMRKGVNERLLAFDDALSCALQASVGLPVHPRLRAIRNERIQEVLLAGCTKSHHEFVASLQRRAMSPRPDLPLEVEVKEFLRSFGQLPTTMPKVAHTLTIDGLLARLPGAEPGPSAISRLLADELTRAADSITDDNEDSSGLRSSAAKGLIALFAVAASADDPDELRKLDSTTHALAASLAFDDDAIAALRAGLLPAAGRPSRRIDRIATQRRRAQAPAARRRSMAPVGAPAAATATATEPMAAITAPEPIASAAPTTVTKAKVNRAHGIALSS